MPIGYIWHREIGLGFDPDMRLQEAIRLIFARFRELGSARQVLLSLTADHPHFPRPSDGKRMIAFDWTPIRYRNVISVLKKRGAKESSHFSRADQHNFPRALSARPSN